MADLTPIANRMNDIEISPNAPVTTATNQKIGSNINILLDSLNLANGATGTTGSFGNLIAATEECSTHTVDKLAGYLAGAVPGTPTSVATIAREEFINQEIFLSIKHSGGGTPTPSSGIGYDLSVSIDSGGLETIPTAYILADTAPVRFSTGIFAGQTYSNAGGLVAGQRSNLREIAVLDYRDCTTDIELFVSFSTAPATFTYEVEIYRNKKLNIGGLSF